jgi:histidine ammonia-lyase
MEALTAMINADALPDVRELGSIGTADLPALAVTALALMGHERAASPVAFGAADGLAFISSNAGALADAALAVSSLAESAGAAVVIAALTFHAVGGNGEAYSDVVRRVTPFPGAAAVCDSLQQLVGADSVGVRRDSTGALIPASRMQDPFGLRAIPQVHGPVLDALRVADTVIKALVNAPGENPVVLADDSCAGGGRAAHHGGFHYVYLQMALDSLAIAVAQSGQLVLSRLAMLIEPGFTELTPFLGDGTPGASGVMVCEYVAASALGSIRAAATPAGLQTASLSRGVEEDASFASLAATQCLSIAHRYRKLLACELVTAVRANRMRAGKPVAGLIGTVMELCTPLPTGLEDRDLSADLAAAVELLPSLAKVLPLDPARASTFGP